MTGVEEILRMIRTGIPVQLTGGKVDSVDDTAMTCLVKIPGRPDRIDVRLRAVITDDMGLTIIPEQGSFVLVALIDNTPESSLMLTTSEVKEIRYKTTDGSWSLTNEGLVAATGDTELMVQPDGYVLKRKNESLLKFMEELIDAINQITVPTGTGPSGVPVNAVVFTDIKTRFKNLLKA